MLACPDLAPPGAATLPEPARSELRQEGLSGEVSGVARDTSTVFPLRQMSSVTIGQVNVEVVTLCSKYMYFEVSVDHLYKTIKHEKATFKDVAAKNLHLFLAETDGEWLASNGSAVRQMRTGDIPAQVKGMLTKEIDPGAQIGAVFRDAPQYDHIHVLVRKGGDMVELQNSLEWREPNPLCKSFGKAWPYQGKEELAATVAGPLADHFNAWKDGNDDKQTHAINLVLSGPGTGKSRMLDEMDGILLRAAELSGSQELVRRMQKVYIFHVTFENGTAAQGSLINPDCPDYDISYRMLYQLTKDRRTDWPAFCADVKRRYGHLPLSIGTVIQLLADLEMTDITNMTVVLCLDGLQKLLNNDPRELDLYAVLASVCYVMNASKAFSVCVCAATVQNPVDAALSDSPQKRVFLVPPVITDDVLGASTRLERQLVEDMGGHGRALEILRYVLDKYSQTQLEEMDPAIIVEEIWDELLVQYSGVFRSPFFRSVQNCRELLVAVFSRRSYKPWESIGTTAMTVDDLRSFGLSRLTREGHLECAFIFLQMLLRKIPKRLSGGDNFSDYLARFVLSWQRFEKFVAFYRRVKSIAYCGETPIDLSTFHAGAHFGTIDGISIKESNARKVVEATNQHITKSNAPPSMIFTDLGDNVDVSEMDTVVINGASALAGDIFSRVQLLIGKQQRQILCNEVLQCKLLKKEKLTEATYHSEMKKAVDTVDVFLLITTAEKATDFPLPPRCGVVSKSEFERYFGPFASRAYQSLVHPPNINTASYHELCRVEGVGVATARKILVERKRKRFSSLADTLERLFPNGSVKGESILRAMHHDDMEAES
ncbi:hypothetical protein ON010_g10539 [Phytophthora cinnamomi]|nr:hypothetical protein ON010_g10539 [Phytophthora cinnamomi]